ncbi:MAG TPA: hydrogenase expression/formation protein HypE [Bacillota bacterium]|nr:hydrogenase expression/formation protein HypE [Bacillota bacterium]HPT87293.1 hydrogenase expression/formation protein HypE [Bacillota bacterium]
MTERITLAHGSGGKLTHQLIGRIFYPHFANDILQTGDDAAKLPVPAGTLAYTTDSFVITPLFFKGGDIGKLSVCGTVNDLATSGARPLALSCGFIIEEGFEISRLERIVSSMAETARSCGVRIVTGDTKVVPKGAADQLFINTSGIGIIPDGCHISASRAKPGDVVIVTGMIGDHGAAILLEREELHIAADIASDCAPLHYLVARVLADVPDIHVLRDPTRGGLASTLHEIALQSDTGILIWEKDIPVRPEVQGICELLGMDPLYLANEGKMVMVVPQENAGKVMEILQSDPLGKDSRIIGQVIREPAKRVLLETVTGAKRIVEMMTGDQLPRIC